MDLLVRKSEDWIKSHLYQNYSGRFCRIEVDDEPEQAGEDDLVLFSDGDTVRAESHIIEINADSIRVEALTPVQKPHPEEPAGTGYEYCDSSDCGKYGIEFMGMEHVFETFHDLTHAILEKRPESRNQDDVFCHVVWTEVQDLDLNNRGDFRDRMSRSEILGIRDEIQMEKVVFPPTIPEVIRKRYSGSSKASRVYQGLENYVEKVKEFYARRQKGEVVYGIDTGFDFEDDDSLEERKQLVRERVSDRTFAEMRGDASA